MKSDEIEMLFGKELPYKRKSYIKNKWFKKGWLKNNKLTQEAERIKELINKNWAEFDGRVVTVYFKYFPPCDGILEDHGDNGFYIYSKRGPTYVSKSKVSYIDYYKYPERLWRKLNYIYWKKEKIENYFHKKVVGKLGECLSTCQCKLLKKNSSG